MKHLCVFLCFVTSTAIAQISTGPRFTALGGASVAMQDAWSVTANQAGSAFLLQPTAAIAYQKQFAGQELSTQGGLIVYPFKSNAVGLSFQNYGFSEYNEQKAGFTYAKRFGNMLAASLTVNYHQLKITSYGSAQTFSVEAGLQYKASDNLTFGAHVANPTRNGYNNSAGAIVPVSMQFGTSYTFTEKLLLAAEVEKNLGDNTDVKAGIEYNLLSWFSLRGGVSVNPFKQYAGFGLQYQKFHFDFAASAHPMLGYSPQVSLQYEF